MTQMSSKTSNSLRKRRKAKEKKSSNAADNSNVGDGFDDSVTSSVNAISDWLFPFAALPLIVLAFIAIWFNIRPSQDKTTRVETAQAGKSEATSTDISSTSRTGKRYLSVYDDFAVLEILPHDPDAFTQGLTWYNGRLFEGTGLHSESELRELDPATGDVLRANPIPVSNDVIAFGEGIAFFTTEDEEHPHRIIQITWQEKIGWIYDAETFEILREFGFETSNGEGWGITYDSNNKEFIVSDGSSNLDVWDRDTLEFKRRVSVFFTRQDGSTVPVGRLNELELNPIKSGSLEVLANVWYADQLVSIDMTDGRITTVYDFTNLYPRRDRSPSADCFNGVAITDVDDEFYVTGKQWPHMYKVKLLK